MSTILRYYRLAGDDHENCFYVEVSEPLAASEQPTLRWLLAETFAPEKSEEESLIARSGGEVVEAGPRLNFETAFSTNAVAICRACGLGRITRIEKSKRWVLPEGADRNRFLAERYDRMTECPYPRALDTFETGLAPEPVFSVPLIKKGIGALHEINREMGLGMDAWDVGFYYDLFANKFRRDPTNVECFQLAQANSEHSRHWFFKGRLIIDGEPAPETLLDIIRSTLHANPTNSVIAFKDNSSAIRGFEVGTIVPREPGRSSPFAAWKGNYDIIFTAETHNFPSGVAPFPGAETGTGGESATCTQPAEARW